MSSFWRTAATYIRAITRVNQWVGQFSMWLFFLMLGILTYGIVADVVLHLPANWVMELSQFAMAAYYLLGGGFTLQEDAHVRVDLLYSRWSPRTRAWMDVVFGIGLLFFLGVLIYGGVESTRYALEFNQKNFTAWGPPLAPIKIIMTLGMLLMFLTAVAVWLKDLATALGRELS